MLTTQSIIILLAIIFAVMLERAGRKFGIAAVPILPWQRAGMIDALRTYAPDHTQNNIAELGCGWGGLIASILRADKTAQITGFEGFWIPALVSRIRFIFYRRVKIRQTDFTKTDLSEFNIVLCYLSHAHMKILETKFRTELKPGSIIISNAFPMPEWPPIKEITTKAVVTHKIYIYKV